eukprot:CAMPEP_0168539318 /NCGR_PEP_ID=MMETSP0405-20121227/21754_1 /TAXON_ID=498012 /ORGANISM="Trichosphaerium sp, Strain Am-I-7 wt" /LENGTH=413 /DNA_ID=CAMNT_0008568853 /DNA_START=117 /DNA_END=1358 /DNA_ORIENTATION=+
MPIFSDYLERELKATPVEMGLIAALGWAGFAIVCVPLGILQGHFGHRPLLVLSSLIGGIGYILLWSSTTHSKPKPSLSLFASCFFFIGMSSYAGFSAALCGNIKNWTPRHRGVIIAIHVAGFGFSSGWYAFMHRWALDMSYERLFFTLAVCHILLPIIGLFLVRDGLIPEVLHITDDVVDKTKIPVSLYGEITCPAIATHPVWLFVWAGFIVGGSSALMLPQVLGPLSKSLRGISMEDEMVFVMAICFGISALASGFLSDFFIRRAPRITWMVPGLLSIAIAQILSAIGMSWYVLWVAVVMNGIGLGLIFVGTLITINAYFGDTNYAANVAWVLLGMAFGDILLEIIGAEIYKSKANDSGICEDGYNCFRIIFIITSVATVLVCLPMTILVRNARKREHRWLHMEEMSDFEDY